MFTIPIANSWKHDFVVESGKIDPQPGHLCLKKGQTMYDNHLSALNFALSDGWELNAHTPLDFHRFLTRGIPFFEDHNASGQYRTCDVWIGDEKCPKPILIPNLMDTWFHTTKKMINNFLDRDGTDEDALNIAWISHHMFEVVHPFIDGNGRTGRLILNKVLKDLGQDPVIVKYCDSYIYYNSIEQFRQNYFYENNFDVSEFVI